MWTAVLHVRPSARALERGDAPLGRVVHVDVERRLVELDDVDAVGGERARFLVEQLGERERQPDAAFLAAAVVAVGDRVDDRHRPGQRELHWLPRVRARQPRLASHGRGPASRSGPTTCGTIAS